MSGGSKRESGGAKGVRSATEAAPDSARGGKGSSQGLFLELL